MKYFLLVASVFASIVFQFVVSDFQSFDKYVDSDFFEQAKEWLPALITASTGSSAKSSAKAALNPILPNVQAKTVEDIADGKAFRGQSFVSNKKSEQMTSEDFTDEKSFLLTPVQDSDPVGRQVRLATRAAFWNGRSYNTADTSLNFDGFMDVLYNTQGQKKYVPVDSGPYRFPTGLLGAAEVISQTINVVTRQVNLNYALFAAKVVPLLSAGIAANGFKSLSSVNAIYNALPSDYKALSADFYKSDSAFAARALTISPQFTKKVKTIGEIPFSESSITGLTNITKGKSLSWLIDNNRLFIQDFTGFDLNATDKAPFSSIETTTTLYFIDNKNRLMPLAIKFSINNQLVYSPLDDANDWFLAKAVTNAICTSVGAFKHFVDTHLIIAQVCLTAEQTLASEHPLYYLLKTTCVKNYGVINTGFYSLLHNGGGMDQLFMTSGKAVRTKIIPHFLKDFNWKSKLLSNDILSRGINNIPNFHYYNDGSALFNIFYQFSMNIFKSYYPNTGSKSVGQDPELVNFFTKLESIIPGITVSEFTSSVEKFSEFVAQCIFLTAVEHQATNSDAVANYLLTFPHSPGKIGFIPPVKGAFASESAMLASSIFYFGASTSSVFFGSVSYGIAYRLNNQASDRLDFGYNIPTYDGSYNAVKQFRQDLIDLSVVIDKRNKAIAKKDDEPIFPLINPKNLPFSISI